MNRIGRLERRAVYAIGSALFLTGIAWAILRYAPQLFDADEHDARSVAAVLMKIHGGAAMLALLILGSLLAHHVRHGWQQTLNKASGSVMLGLAALLAVTGYLLYYAGGEDARQAASWVHLVGGALLPVAVCVHVLRLLRLRARRTRRCSATLLARR